MWCNESYDNYYAMHIIVVVLQGRVHYSPMHILYFVLLVVFFVMVICAGLGVGVHSEFSNLKLES